MGVQKSESLRMPISHSGYGRKKVSGGMFSRHRGKPKPPSSAELVTSGNYERYRGKGIYGTGGTEWGPPSRGSPDKRTLGRLMANDYFGLTPGDYISTWGAPVRGTDWGYNTYCDPEFGPQ